MNRDEAIKLIEKKALEILEANGYEDDGLCGRIGDGCEIEGEPLWVFWPTTDGEKALGLYANAVMDEDHQVSPFLSGLVNGWEEMQAFLREIEG